MVVLAVGTRERRRGREHQHDGRWPPCSSRTRPARRTSSASRASQGSWLVEVPHGLVSRSQPDAGRQRVHSGSAGTAGDPRCRLAGVVDVADSGRGEPRCGRRPGDSVPRDRRAAGGRHDPRRGRQRPARWLQRQRRHRRRRWRRHDQQRRPGRRELGASALRSCSAPRRRRPTSSWAARATTRSRSRGSASTSSTAVREWRRRVEPVRDRRGQSLQHGFFLDDHAR